MSDTEITITFDPDKLSGYEDRYLLMLLHLTQHNPADGFTSKKPGEVAQKVKDEIVRRWIRTVVPELYRHQDRHYYWRNLTRFAQYEPGSKDGFSPEWHNGQWVAREQEDEAERGSDGTR